MTALVFPSFLQDAEENNMDTHTDTYIQIHMQTHNGLGLWNGSLLSLERRNQIAHNFLEKGLLQLGLQEFLCNKNNFCRTKGTSSTFLSICETVLSYQHTPNTAVSSSDSVLPCWFQLNTLNLLLYKVFSYFLCIYRIFLGQCDSGLFLYFSATQETEQHFLLYLHWE